MYNSQYYTCEQIDQRLLQGYLDDYNSENNTNLTKTKFLNLLATHLNSGLTITDIVQESGNNIDKIMSQAIVTRLLSNLQSNINARDGYYQATINGGTIIVNAPDYLLGSGGNLRIKMPSVGTTASTMTIGNANAVQLWYNGAAVSSDNTWEAGEIISVFYDGTRFMASNSQGGGKFATGQAVKDISIYNNLVSGTGTALVTNEAVVNQSKKSLQSFSSLAYSGHPTVFKNKAIIGTDRIITSNTNAKNYVLYTTTKFKKGDIIHFTGLSSVEKVTRYGFTNVDLGSLTTIIGVVLNEEGFFDYRGTEHNYDIVVPSDDLYFVLFYNSDDWNSRAFTIYQTWGFDSEPLPASTKLINSGSVYNSFKALELNIKEEVLGYTLGDYALTSDGNFGTGSNIKHGIIEVSAGEIYYLTGESTNCRYAFAISDAYSSGEGIPFVEGTQVVNMPTIGEYYRAVIPEGCTHLLFNAAGTYGTRVFKVVNDIPKYGVLDYAFASQLYIDENGVLRTSSSVLNTIYFRKVNKGDIIHLSGNGTSAFRFGIASTNPLDLTLPAQLGSFTSIYAGKIDYVFTVHESGYLVIFHVSTQYTDMRIERLPSLLRNPFVGEKVVCTGGSSMEGYTVSGAPKASEIIGKKLDMISLNYAIAGSAIAKHLPTVGYVAPEYVDIFYKESDWESAKQGGTLNTSKKYLVKDSDVAPRFHIYSYSGGVWSPINPDDYTSSTHYVADYDEMFCKLSDWEAAKQGGSLDTSKTYLVHDTPSTRPFYHLYKYTNGSWGVFSTGDSSINNAKAPLVDRIRELDTDADVILLDSGGNDWAHYWTPMGDDFSRDKYTFCGAMHLICQYLVNTFPGKIIIWMSRPAAWRYSDDSYTESQFYDDFYTRWDAPNPLGFTPQDYDNNKKMILREYGIEYFDLGCKLGFSQENRWWCGDPQNGGFYAHPGAQGQEQIANAIIKEMMTYKL